MSAVLATTTRNPQRALPLAVPASTPLVDLNAVRAVRGVDADTILADVDEGRLRWVWNVAAQPGEIRELRFWTLEVNLPDSVRRVTLEQVTDLILGARAEWRGPEIAQLLIVSRPTVHRLQHELKAARVGGVLKCQRSGLADFFKRRLV